jgi:hypothetical protein
MYYRNPRNIMYTTGLFMWITGYIDGIFTIYTRYSDLLSSSSFEVLWFFVFRFLRFTFSFSSLKSELCSRVVHYGKPMDSKYSVIKPSGAHNFYLVSIVYTILPSFKLSPTAPGHKKRKNKKIKTKFKPVPRADKKQIPVGCQMYCHTRRIEIQNRFV